MFASPEFVTKLSPLLSTQLTKTYKDEDSHLRQLTSFKNCITVDDYLAVAHKNAVERIKVYRELFGTHVSEFNPTGAQEAQEQGPADQDYVLIELTQPKRTVKLLVCNMPTESYRFIESLLQSKEG